MNKDVFMKYFFLIGMMSLMIYGCSRINPIVSETKVLEIKEINENDVVYNLGIIEIGNQTILELKLKNTLQKPVIIDDVVRFCGCTIPEFNSSPILPQKSSIVKFTFVADHPGLFSKAVKIYLDIQKKPVQILFKGEIVGSGKIQ